MILQRGDGRDHRLERAAAVPKNSRAQPRRNHHRAPPLGALRTGSGGTGAAVRDEYPGIARASHLNFQGGGPK